MQQIGAYCSFGWCSLDDALHGLPQYTGAYASYSECGDGSRRFHTSPGNFGGDEQLAYGADGTLIYASGVLADNGSLGPVCGSSFETPADVTCEFCQVCLGAAECGGIGGAGGESGAGGAAGAAGAAGIGAVPVDSSGNPYCLVDTTGAVVMPPGARTL